ncbi:MAG: hypothetical protein OXF56_17060, partial [Rhodobacteraceae bacterium]|nr:hypothetical protein [Paracoccaceae bacterium]
AIECLFSDAKTRGFNIEDTQITDSAKLSTLLGIVTLVVTWAHRRATRVMGRKPVLVQMLRATFEPELARQTPV